MKDSEFYGAVSAIAQFIEEADRLNCEQGERQAGKTESEPQGKNEKPEQR